nr:hypothetical protein [Acidobacteriota bacterium]
MKFAGLLLSLVVGLRAEPPVIYDCPSTDIDLFGLTCTEQDPCPVLLELTASEAAGNRVLVTGNLHTRNITLFSLLLASDDTGLTWTEPMPRMRSAALEQIEFWD